MFLVTDFVGEWGEVVSGLSRMGIAFWWMGLCLDLKMI